jgi:hypothetical protein
MTITAYSTFQLLVQNLLHKTTIADAIYLFKFIDTQDNEKLIVLNDVMSGATSYSLFDIDIVSSLNDEDLNDSKIYLKNGEYEYQIYQTEDGTMNTAENAFNGKPFIHNAYFKIDIEPVINKRVITQVTNKRIIE